MSAECGDEIGSFWTVLAQLHEARLPMADWRRHLAAEFAHLQPFLSECTGEIAVTIPCPRSGQRLNVSRRGGMFAAFPDEEHEGDAEALTDLSLADVSVLRFDENAFRSALCRALDLTPITVADASDGDAHLIGSIGHGESRKRVYLGDSVDEQRGMAFCVSVVQKSRQRCCVVLPIFLPQCDEYLRQCEHDLIVLSEAVAFGAGGLVAKRRETVREIEDLVVVTVVGDYKALCLHDGTMIDLSRRTKCRALVRHLHQRRKITGNREFLYQDEVDKLNAGQKAILIQSGDFKFGLFRGIHQHFDLLFTTLDRGFGRYRINF